MPIRQNSLKNILREKGMSQVELATALGTDAINFNKIVNNKRGLDHELAFKIAKILDIQWFQVYEPMNVELIIQGELDSASDSLDVRFIDPVDDKIRKIKLNTFLDVRNNTICILESGTESVWLMLKDMKEDYPSENGLHYAKFPDGSVKFITKRNGTLFRWNPMIPMKDKLFKQKPKLQYSIPVSRIDYDWEWVDRDNEGED